MCQLGQVTWRHLLGVPDRIVFFLDLQAEVRTPNVVVSEHFLA